MSFSSEVKAELGRQYSKRDIASLQNLGILEFEGEITGNPFTLQHFVRIWS